MNLDSRPGKEKQKSKPEYPTHLRHPDGITALPENPKENSKSRPTLSPKSNQDLLMLSCLTAEQYK